jgi:hypothetical protein
VMFLAVHLWLSAVAAFNNCQLPPASGNEPDQLCTPSRPKHTAKPRFL